MISRIIIKVVIPLLSILLNPLLLIRSTVITKEFNSISIQAFIKNSHLKIRICQQTETIFCIVALPWLQDINRIIRIGRFGIYIYSYFRSLYLIIHYCGCFIQNQENAFTLARLPPLSKSIQLLKKVSVIILRLLTGAKETRSNITSRNKNHQTNK